MTDTTLLAPIELSDDDSDELIFVSSVKLGKRKSSDSPKPRKALKQTSLQAAPVTPTADRSDAAKAQLIQLGQSPGSGSFAIHPHIFDLEAAFTRKAAKPIIKPPDLDLLLFKPLMTPEGCSKVYSYLLNELPWYKVKYTVRKGIDIVTPRYTTVFGQDDTKTQALSRYKKRPRPIPYLLEELKRHVESISGATYNFVLCNFYSDGKDSISWHSDDEAFLGPQPTISSLSLGGARDFYIKHKADGTDKHHFSLQDGDLLVMRGKTQERYLHSIPKRAVARPRINITFRRAINTYGTDNYYKYNVGDGPIYRFRDGKMCLADSTD
ncbi:hypothetical protein E5Q_02155 [Mixia osmundae IAM 14324]|uniref:Fe2OG dioxygenase domain-containing protein n=1 Tax=Mixia osmundae (strain CBS 9802 / IAM 14324 / JCM 22182 / KY 12970) TaxID=764103 RepID=G7DY40_MIXOS|nr:hypothetical protein E5Q_02155 [Mixia osmundae IAM 14324]